MTTTKKPIQLSLKEYGRGITGGLLFSLPMLYTMELWWAGFIANTLQLILYLFVGIGLLIVYNKFVGLREDTSFSACFSESLEEMGLGIILTIFILWVTGRIMPTMSIEEITGKVVVEAVTVAIGISVGKSQLGRESEDEEGEEGEEKKEKEKSSSTSSNHLRAIGIAICGAILISSNIAPTDEVVVIALEAENYKLLLIALFSIGLGGAVIYYINFTGTERMAIESYHGWKPIAGTVIMYAIALSTSAFMLWFFGRFGGLSLYGIIAETIVLGFPATLGASAGRLLIQT